eukprot:scaffold14077_cov55-Attheya_sp.AAC.2
MTHRASCACCDLHKAAAFIVGCDFLFSYDEMTSLPNLIATYRRKMKKARDRLQKVSRVMTD